ncbi:hypothetical protein M9435_006750 [Picochlorum sp. BPE23]|nr:hypothetical protein M9435_006750 [Picochlorum sp. BPE23]
MGTGNTVEKRVVLRDHHRPIPITKTLRQLRRMLKSAESTLQRKMSTFEGGQYVLLVKALRQNRSGLVHEVVEIVGSPGLKESFETHLSDVLNDVPADKDDSNAPPITEACDPADKDATEAKGTAVEKHVTSDAAELYAPPSSSLAPSSVSLAVEDSQDSILDIEGATDDEEVSLMGWNADDAGGGAENGNAAAKISIAAASPKHNKDSGNSTKQQDCGESWRSLVHRDDPFLCLVPCEIAHVAVALQDHQYNHLETYRQLGFRVSDALVEWFDSGVGHQVWRTVHSEHAHVLQSTLTPRRRDNVPTATKRKRARSTGPAKPIWTNGSHSQIKASKARQRQAAQTKA